MEKDFEELIAGFIANKIGISEHFLSVELCQHLAANLMVLQMEDSLIAAGVGNDAIWQQSKLIRKDKIFWLDKKHNNVHENAFFAKMDAFVMYLNQTCYTNIKSYEFHYSLYESGDFYVKHLDQFKDDASRQYSVVSYLNPLWKANDGGELMIYQTNNNKTISPTQGKTVFFKSNELEHEVLVTQERRMSVTGWLKKG